MVVLRKVLMGLLENTFAHITYIQMHIRQRTHTFAASWCMSLRQVGLPSMKNFFIMEWNQPLKVGFRKMRPKENYWEEWLWATQHSCSNIILANARGVCTDNSDPMWCFLNSLRVVKWHQRWMYGDFSHRYWLNQMRFHAIKSEFVV